MNNHPLSPLDSQLLQDLLQHLNAPEQELDKPIHDREYLLNIAANAGPELGNVARILFSTLRDLKRSHLKMKQNPQNPLLDTINQALQNTPKIFPKQGIVACQGCEGAYSQQACEKIMPEANIMYVKNFEGVFQAVQNGLCEYGILPIENSLHGTVGAVYDLLQNYQVHIIRSFKLQINHALMANPGVKMADIKEIISHEQALGQCGNFLKEHKDLRTVVCENTAQAAHDVAESGRRDIAAISSPGCANLYDLQILNGKIQNSDHNYTRFICISKDLRIYPGANRISLIISVPHKPGALYKMIARFSALDLNLTKLESRPIPGKDFEFMFYFDLEASAYSQEVWNLLEDMSREPDVFMLLGCYAEA